MGRHYLFLALSQATSGKNMHNASLMQLEGSEPNTSQSGCLHQAGTQDVSREVGEPFYPKVKADQHILCKKVGMSSVCGLEYEVYVEQTRNQFVCGSSSPARQNGLPSLCLSWGPTV